MEHYKSTARGNFIALSVYIKKVHKSHTSDLTAYLKTLEQKEEDSLRRRRQQEAIKLMT